MVDSTFIHLQPAEREKKMAGKRKLNVKLGMGAIYRAYASFRTLNSQRTIDPLFRLSSFSFSNSVAKSFKNRTRKVGLHSGRAIFS
jgi:hypothetical protein